MSFWKWSRTAANNATADGSINWAEGQAPSTVNDSARAMMAAASKYRDDVAGAIATAGSGTAYTLTSFQVFDTLAHMDGAMIAFTPHAGNGGACTLNVDGLGANPAFAPSDLGEARGRCFDTNCCSIVRLLPRPAAGIGYELSENSRRFGWLVDRSTVSTAPKFRPSKA